MLSTTVQQMVAAKGDTVWSVTPEATVYQALELMAAHNVGALVVLRGDAPVGVFSERDYARKVVLRGKSSKDTPVEEIMTTLLYCVRPEQTTEECMALMTDKHVRHLPVMDAGRLAGIISIGDVVKAIVDEQHFVIRQLETYIAGGR